MRTLLSLFCLLLTLPLTLASAQAPEARLEELHNKTILVFTPHPDDDVFGAGGTIALLNRNHNKVLIVVYTNDDKGSYDPDMSSQRLAGIRRAEQEVSEGLLGTPKENIMWMGYDDGMLEYAAQPKLTEEATAIIRRVRPDVLLSVDPGEWYERWHKTDHRMAAVNTIDAVRAAEFWLYFPNQRLQQGLQPYTVPEMYFFYPSPQEANYYVNIDAVADLKFDAAAKQVSQFEPSVNKYRPDCKESRKSERRYASRTTAQGWALRGSLPPCHRFQSILRARHTGKTHVRFSNSWWSKSETEAVSAV